jgi:hypothetical protein
MTGRAAGLCAGYPTPGYTTPGYGRGYGRGVGRGFGRGSGGRGRGFWWRGYNPEPYHPPTKTTEEEKTYLENIIKELEEEIHGIKERIKELSKEKKENP